MKKADAVVDAGTCGFVTSVVATVTDENQATFAVESPCEHVQKIAGAIIENGPFDVYEDMEWQKESRLRETLRTALKGCYPWCPVPLAVFKTMQLAAGLSLPKDIVIELSSDPSQADAQTATSPEEE